MGSLSAQEIARSEDEAAAIQFSLSGQLPWYHKYAAYLRGNETLESLGISENERTRFLWRVAYYQLVDDDLCLSSYWGDNQPRKCVGQWDVL